MSCETLCTKHCKQDEVRRKKTSVLYHTQYVICVCKKQLSFNNNRPQEGSALCFSLMILFPLNTSLHFATDLVATFLDFETGTRSLEQLAALYSCGGQGFASVRNVASCRYRYH